MMEAAPRTGRLLSGHDHDLASLEQLADRPAAGADVTSGRDAGRATSRVLDEEAAVRWSVGIEAEGDRVLTPADVVELADAVAGNDGIATGIGTTRYGAQLVVEADTRDDAIARATEVFLAAASTAGLPAVPIVRTEAISEQEESGDLDEPGEQR